MVEIGSIIRAKVTRVEPYGVWFEHAAGSVVVLAPELSWSDRRPPGEWIHPGDEFDVLVVRYNYRDRTMVGSLRRLHPDQNPYRQLARLDPGTVLHGRVRYVLHNEVTVELPNGAWGHISASQAATPMKRDDDLELVIVDIDVEEGRLRLEPAPVPAGPPCAVGPELPIEANV